MNEPYTDFSWRVAELEEKLAELGEELSGLENRLGIMRDALEAAAYVCEGVAVAPNRPETVAPSYARSVAKQCRRALEPHSPKLGAT